MDQTKKIVARVRSTIQKYGMIDPGDLVVVAVSGGPDSMCLLDILNRLSDDLEIGLIAAHYDHSLRPDEDEEETRLVEGFSKILDLPFKSEKSPVNREENTLSEEEARTARYKFLEKVRVSENAHKIATGHNLNDQAETVIMRILRGSGASGISGIPPLRDNQIIRPLIEISREVIEEYSARRAISYAIDSSNKEKRFLRNRIRLELLPLMLEYQPRLIMQLGRLSNIIREESHYLEERAQEFVDKEINRGSKGEISIYLPSFQRLPSALKKRIIRLLFKRAGNSIRKITSEHITATAKLVESSKPQGIINLPNELIVRKEYDRLVFSLSGEKEIKGFEYTLNGPEQVFMESIGRSIQLTEITRAMVPEKMDLPDVAYLNAEKVQYPLKVRNFKPGDRFIPLGMRGSRKIKDFFIDLKIPSRIRKKIPILINREEVVWVCGYRIDERYKITPTTKRVLKVILS